MGVMIIMKHFTWGYEEDRLGKYYNVYPISKQGEYYFYNGSVFTVDVQRTDNNDKIVDTIVQLLDCFVDLNYKENKNDTIIS